ncbi:MAG: gliding motility-associated C-terminal domain-containing protein, partial [Bacteroidota bacterium]
VYNRWGRKVFEANGYNNTWRGNSQDNLNFRNDRLPEGTYYYVLSLNDGTERIFKGSVYINR